MDKDTRNAIQTATQKARKLLEEDYAAQLEGDFDVHRDGNVAARAGSHLGARQRYRRERIVAAIGHKRAAGMSAADAVRDYLRDAAFTTLNRYVALKMLEARELVQECITRGEQSAGYREYCGMAPGLPLLPGSAGYRLYLESLFDELSTEVKVLFDRRDPASVLWPKRATFEQLLTLLNAAELARVWSEDETIGWVYQYFNGQDERKKMREESQAPRNSRELALRNQFFTPRYVVQFLTDNTLGRIWYEMRGTRTALAEQCEYLVRRPDETFAPRPKKDPRDLRVLDPACGSGHFLLYAYDLLLTIYAEAHADPESPTSEVTGRTLAADYPSLDALKQAVPGLVLAHNLHGVDIDPRCAQIAQLALWMRAQRAYRDFGIQRAARPPIRRSNIVIAEPLIADEQIAREFVAKLGDAELGRVFLSLVEALRLAGELGLLLRIEKLVGRPLQRGQMGDLFAPPEARIQAALERFVREEAGATNTRRRLFADDAVHGMALLGIAEQKFDVVLMNPPMSEASSQSKSALKTIYPSATGQLAPAFLVRATDLNSNFGAIGAVCNRPPMFIQGFEKFRRTTLMGKHGLRAILDIGDGDFEDAIVEVAAVVLLQDQEGKSIFAADVKRDVDKSAALLEILSHDIQLQGRSCSATDLFRIPGAPVAYWLPESILKLFKVNKSCENLGVSVNVGLSTKNDRRFVRAFWEVQKSDICFKGKWSPYDKGGEYSSFFFPVDLVVRSSGDFKEIDAEVCQKFPYLKGNSSWIVHPEANYGAPGASFQMLTTKDLAPRLMPSGCVFYIAMTKNNNSHDRSPEVTTAVFNSSIIRVLVDALVGGGGGTLKNYEKGTISRVPVPSLSSHQLDRLASATESAVLAKINCQYRFVETASAFQGLPAISSLNDAHLALQKIASEGSRKLKDVLQAIDETLAEAFGLNARELEDVVSLARTDLEISALEIAELAYAYLSIFFGMAFDRYRAAEILIDPERTGALQASWKYPEVIRNAGRDILVDDFGHKDDICNIIESRLLDAMGNSMSGFIEQICKVLAKNGSERTLRSVLCFDFWGNHVRSYTIGRIKSPIYWQLATPSASYSVWLYIHAFNKDTLFRIQNDYVAPKLAHEERRLEALASELRHGATAGQRKQFAAQEAFVEELRAMLEEIRRVAPLWNPNLDDGVIINFAPLWRLVPQHKPWQKELKSAWDELCARDYDWAHLAMHLWPEHVVPKCAKDRSLAIAHGLEDVFWIEGSDGKWTARQAPTRSIEALVAERSSPAVKSALQSLLDAPAASAARKPRKGKNHA